MLEDDEFDSDSVYEGDDSSSLLPPRREGCLRGLREIMERFKVRGHSAMQ